YGEAEADYRPLPQQVLVGWIEAMGQSLFAPPNVKGWPGGPSWLNTSTVLERDNFAATLAMGTLWPDTAPDPTPRALSAPLTLGPIVRRITKSTAPLDAPEEPARAREWQPGHRPRRSLVHVRGRAVGPGWCRRQAPQSGGPRRRRPEVPHRLPQCLRHAA